MNKIIAVITLVLSLVLINFSIIEKEKHLSNTDIVYLKLAPVDPRSLMQGDYMTLRFALSEKIRRDLPKVKNNSKSWQQSNDDSGANNLGFRNEFEALNWRYDLKNSDGYVVVVLDDKNVASYVRLHENETLLDNEVLLFYRVRNNVIKFATNAFFFQEGKAKEYDSAKYGKFHVDENGKLLLTTMHNLNLKLLGK